ncbi:LacI family DNA-binding transcriptional regulator [Puniceicoccus vermicola]|uniref:LacI family DNA-binding transcriptional regulator n=1 Tax=Puniceicoccus vermicola TaxID=388746 RepID=A0A7X1B1E5_9BACT|nr:LacI family DNA-binding transcriptional regulator [Puniceicoccus vermicola]MBC2603850.1 LacI family DNA-binding transcriptional regulator [Puniceicoccus vermicola]
MNLDAIAQAAGVSRMTVSRVMRNHPDVSRKTRERVLGIASAMNYRPNPMVSVLMSQVAAAKKSQFHPTLVYGWEHEVIRTRAALEKSKGGYFKWVKRRAEQLGFHVEALRINEEGMSQKRYSDILKARNTPGLIIAPAEDPEVSYDFDWDAMSSVTFGYSLRRPALNRVCLDYQAGIYKALKRLTGLGYRKFGLMLGKTTDDRIQHLWSSGFLTFHWEADLNCKSNIYIAETDSQDAFVQWFESHPFEVVLSYAETSHIEWARSVEARLNRKRACQFVHLDGDFMEESALFLGSLESCRRQMGEAAVELLVAQIKQNEHGVPDRQRSVVIQPELILNGESCQS